MLVVTQALTVIGIYFLVDGLAPREQQTGFLLSSLVTILTTYGIFSHTRSIEETPIQPTQEDHLSATNFRLDPVASVNSL